ncbi:hypothetical protein EKO04_006386 [Ascochyta lentis]|uniref:Uncharacterized protein n=1 Tax=Ascochyta lentis TaxID=205686 RepID=A0A8H7J2K5_9PLEO|nr:hypothetical protein EKO04_006386 [Ascochyta lentis]
MSGVQEQQASKLENNNPLGKVTDKVKSALSSDDKSGAADVKSDDIGFKPTDPTGKDGRAVAENDTKSAGDTTSLPTMTGASGHPTN